MYKDTGHKCQEVFLLFFDLFPLIMIILSLNSAGFDEWTLSFEEGYFVFIILARVTVWPGLINESASSFKLLAKADKHYGFEQVPNNLTSG